HRSPWPPPSIGVSARGAVRNTGTAPEFPATRPGGGRTPGGRPEGPRPAKSRRAVLGAAVRADMQIGSLRRAVAAPRHGQLVEVFLPAREDRGFPLGGW